MAGLIGVPWFAGHASGYVGASFGFIVGFILCAILCGGLAERGADRSLLGSVPAMLAGEVVMYAVGVIWLAAYLDVGAAKAISLGLTPFLLAAWTLIPATVATLTPALRGNPPRPLPATHPRPADHPLAPKV